jgi:hypothetical protein
MSVLSVVPGIHLNFNSRVGLFLCPVFSQHILGCGWGRGVEQDILGRKACRRPCLQMRFSHIQVKVMQSSEGQGRAEFRRRVKGQRERTFFRLQKFYQEFVVLLT